MEAEGKAGEQQIADGTPETLRLGRLGDLVVSELQGRFYENNRNARLFCGGMVALTSISNATFTIATPGVTCTPIAGVWNPIDSDVDLIILQALLGLTITALQATGGGPFAWAASVGNSAISTGAAPTNLKTLNAAGSRAKDVSGVALTGMANNLRVLRGAAVNGGSASNAAFLATQVAMQASSAGPPVENIDGGFIVPPGGVLALLATSTPVAHSAVSGLIWSEQPRAS